MLVSPNGRIIKLVVMEGALDRGFAICQLSHH